MAWSLASVLAWTGGANAAPSFSASGTFQVGASPASSVTGDFNGDGVLDAAVANTASGVVTVLLGDGDGGFSSVASCWMGGASGYLATGDLNRDGALDLVATCPTKNYIYSALGVSDGTFRDPVATYTHSYPIAVTLGRFDADDYLDVAVTEAEYGAVDALRGQGNGSFSWSGYWTVGASPACVIARDVTGDGQLDLIVTKTGSSAVEVLRGNGNGTFTALVDLATGSAPVCVSVGDFNLDGLLDVVSANSGANTLTLYDGHGDGTFSNRRDIATATSPKCVAVQDLDGDHVPDLVVANSGSAILSVFMGKGDGTFSQAPSVAVGNGPSWVTIGDFNADGHPDLLCSNFQDNTVTLLLQNVPLSETTTALALDPNPSVCGQEVTLTATVTPGGVAGTVLFLDNSVSRGSAPVVNGVATLRLNDLRRGEHLIVACLQRTTRYEGSCSVGVLLNVDLDPTQVVVRVLTSPAYHRAPCRFAATVAAMPPGSGTPAGRVQFWVDSVALGEPVTLVDASATSPATDSLSVGRHSAWASYIPADTLYYQPSISTPVVQEVATSNPQIVKVRDVPNDQGGHVFVTWHCPLDQSGFNVIKGYRIWRRVPGLALTASGDAGGAPVRVTGRSLGAADDSLGPETFWEELAELPAARLVSYGFTAPTTQDSMANANPYTAFVVQALTANDLEFFASAPDSGYSVDNLSPQTPAPFAVVYTAQSNALHWAKSSAPDLREFRVYRGGSATFELAASSLVVATSDTGFVDAPGAAYYKLVAVDIHGNLSRVVTASPQSPVALLASLVRVDVLADRISLLWYAGGNGALSATVYRREGIADWQSLGTVSADGEGYLRFTDQDVVPGGRYGYRLGVVDGDGEMFLGEAWATAEQPQLRLAGVWPNPAHGNRLNVVFTLPSAERADLQLFDVTGRQVSGCDVGDLGPGRHQVNLANGTRLRPGVYLVRLIQGPQAMVARVVVVD